MPNWNSKESFKGVLRAHGWGGASVPWLWLFFSLLFLSLSFRPAQIQQAGKKEGVWGGNFCQRLLSANGGVSVWGFSEYAPPPSLSVGGANIIVFARKKFERNRANTTKYFYNKSNNKIWIEL